MTDESQTSPPATTALATFGGGCFWCTEAFFQEIDGVSEVTSGFAGGALEDPGYEDVISGRSGHAEVIQIRYDPKRVAYASLLEVFFGTHDPTTLNRQGADFGTQYRSIVLYHDDTQKGVAEAARAALDRSGTYPNPVVTEVVPFDRFYPAEAYHQEYYRANPQAFYCRAVITPKLEKFRKTFAALRALSLLLLFVSALIGAVAVPGAGLVDAYRAVEAARK